MGAWTPPNTAHARAWQVRPLLLRQCARWLSEAGPTVKAPMERCYTELRALLDALDESVAGTLGSGASGSSSAADEAALAQ